MSRLIMEIGRINRRMVKQQLQALSTEGMLRKVYERGRADYGWFQRKALDVNPRYYWTGMEQMNISVRDNEKTAIGAGHGVSKTYTLARLCLTFLYCYYPSTVITTAPTMRQVKELLWREIRESHAAAKLPLGGKPMTTMLDLQRETGKRWFAEGIATKADTVTSEATKIQGYHNDYMLIALDEAAAILVEIWRAIRHIGAPFKRIVAIGNRTTAAGEFARCFKDPEWNTFTIPVISTPNYVHGRTIIPGVYGREYADPIREKYGEDSDEYKVRVMGEESSKLAPGAYYGAKIRELRKNGRIGKVDHHPSYLVHIVRDPGYTSAFWFFQLIGVEIHFIRYYEDSGVGIEDYHRLFDTWRKDYGYHYGSNFVPCDMDSNATRIITGQTALDTLKSLDANPVALPVERRVDEGIERTLKFLNVCRFDAELCRIGIESIEAYHQRVNKNLSTEDKIVLTGEPEKDGTDHAADALRYASMAVVKGFVRTGGAMTADQTEELWARARGR